MSWLSPTRWLITAGLLAGLLAGLWASYAWWRGHQQDIGRNEVRAEWTAEKLAASEAARQREKALTIANQEIDHAYQKDKQRRAAADLATTQRLRDFEAALAGAGRVDPAAEPGADDPRGVVAGECGAALKALDGYAAKLAGQASALQGYINGVCLAGPPGF